MTCSSCGGKTKVLCTYPEVNGKTFRSLQCTKCGKKMTSCETEASEDDIDFYSAIHKRSAMYGGAKAPRPRECKRETKEHIIARFLKPIA